MESVTPKNSAKSLQAKMGHNTYQMSADSVVKLSTRKFSVIVSHANIAIKNEVSAIAE